VGLSCGVGLRGAGTLVAGAGLVILSPIPPLGVEGIGVGTLSPCTGFIGLVGIIGVRSTILVEGS